MEDLLHAVRASLAGRYEIERELGRGAMAVVFLARDPKHDRQVAVKVLDPELGRSLGARRFLREIEIAAHLQHPHIVPLFDSGEAGGFVYFVMPRVEGETLRERIDREGPLPVGEAVQIARQVSSALAYAHQRGIVHRDIKPSNILLSHGAAVVTDFGIAAALDRAVPERLTATGLALGSPAYMSPEQAGAERDVDGRSDIYSLGCVLYEMLTGHAPFSGGSFAALLAQHAAAPVPPLSATRGPVPYAVEHAVHRALAKTPEERFDAAEEFAVALSRAPGWRGRLTDLAGDVWRRRVPQVVVAYVLLTWLIVRAVDLAADRLVLSPHLPGFALTALLSLLPTAGIIAYFHGGVGRSWPAAERLGVTLNVVAAAALLLLLYADKSLGRMALPLTYEDRPGHLTEQLVPRQEFRRRLALFEFSTQGLDSALAWLGFGIPYALDADLGQDLIVDVSVGFEEELRRAGMSPGAEVPLALQRQVAEKEGFKFLYRGEVAGDADTLTIRASLVDVKRGTPVRTRSWSVPASQVLPLVDELSLSLREDMGVSSGYLERVTDLPASEVLTADPEAFHLYALALHRRDAGHGDEEAIALLRAAVESDTTFALAWNDLALLALESGDDELARRAKEAALAADWRLPPSQRLALLQGHYLLTGQPERALEAVKTRAALYPTDVEAGRQLADLYVLRRQLPEAVAEYERLYALEPERPEYLRAIARIYRNAGDERATRWYREWRAAVGDRPEVLTEIGEYLQRTGQRDSAIAYYEKALLLSPRDVSARIGLAETQRDAGEFEAATGGLREALAVSGSPEETARVHDALSGLFRELGQLDSARFHAEAAWEEGEAFHSSLQRDLNRLSMLDLVALTTGPEAALEEARKVAARLPPPFDGLASWGRVAVFRAMQDPDSLAAAVKELREGAPGTLLEQALADEFLTAEGDVALWKGDCSTASDRYEAALAADPALLETRIALARARLACGDRKGAREVLDAAALRAPGDPSLRVVRAELLAGEGDTAAALTELDAALGTWEAADPGFREADEARRLRARLAES